MLYLHAMGHFHPENIISNKFLEDLDIGTTNDWIMERVGIQNRRTVLPLDYIRQTKNINPMESYSIRQYKNYQMGAAAARMALKRASLKPEDIGLVIGGTSSPDNISPAEALCAAWSTSSGVWKRAALAPEDMAVLVQSRLRELR